MSTTSPLSLSSPLRHEVPIDVTVRRAQQGDPDAFGTLYDTHAGRVYALCLRMAGDPGRATELVQDVFVRVWSRLGSFRGESTFSTWLHRLAVNVVLQQVRTDRRRRERVVAEADLDPVASSSAGRTPNPGTRLDLEAALRSLPEVLRQVVVLHDVEGYRHDEIAALLDCPVGTARSHLFRARRILRERLS